MAVSNFGVVWENKRQSASALAANSNFNKSVNNLNVGHWTDAWRDHFQRRSNVLLQ